MEEEDGNGERNERKGKVANHGLNNMVVLLRTKMGTHGGPGSEP